MKRFLIVVALICVSIPAWAGMDFIPPIGAYSSLEMTNLSMDTINDMVIGGDNGYNVITNLMLYGRLFECNGSWSSVPYQITMMGGWDSTKHCNFPQTIWFVTTTKKYDEYGQACAMVNSMSPSLFSTYTGPVTRQIVNRAWGTSASASLTDGSKNYAISTWYPWKDVATYARNQTNNLSQTTISGAVNTLARVLGDYDIVVSYQSVGGLNVISQHYTLTVGTDVFRWNGKLDAVNTYLDINRQWPTSGDVAADPSIVPTPDTGGAGAGDTPSFWESLFVPSQTSIDNLKMATGQYSTWGPFGVWNAVTNGFNARLDGSNQIDQTPFVLPLNLGYCDVEMDLSAYEYYILGARLLMAGGLWFIWFMAVWKRVGGHIAGGTSE